MSLPVESGSQRWPFLLLCPLQGPDPRVGVLSTQMCDVLLAHLAMPPLLRRTQPICFEVQILVISRRYLLIFETLVWCMNLFRFYFRFWKLK